MREKGPQGLARTRVDQVGSLLRPAGLKDAFVRRAEGRATDEELRLAQDDAIRAVVARQEAVGLPVVTDGEYRRLNWQVSFSEVAGWDMWATSWERFRRAPGDRAPDEVPLRRGADAVVTFRTPVTGPLRLVRNAPLEEFQFTRTLTARPVKVTLIGPDRIRQMSDVGAPGSPYRDTWEFLDAVVAVQRQMVSELVEAGCRYLQLDEPSYTGYVDQPTLERMRERGEDPETALARGIAADSAVADAVRGRAVVGLHVCRGNRASMWHREGPYDAIAERLFTGLRVDRLLLEYDTERAGTFAPLRFVPPGPTVVLGLITTKTGLMENVDELRRRIEEASRYVPLEQLALSPQCGFASGIGGNLLGEDAQWRKLEIMLETARRVWG